MALSSSGVTAQPTKRGASCPISTIGWRSVVSPKPGPLDKAGVPNDRRGYRSRHQLALDMLEHNGVALPHGPLAIAGVLGVSKRSAL